MFLKLELRGVVLGRGWVENILIFGKTTKRNMLIV